MRGSRGGSAFSSTEPVGISTTGAARRQWPFSSTRLDTGNSSQHFFSLQGDESEVSSTGGRPHTIQGEKSKQPRMGNEDISLHQKMDDLNERVERLTALLMAQQQ